MNLHRRDFLLSAAASAAGGRCASPDLAAATNSKQGRFKLRYAPHFGMFKHSAGADLIDQVKFMADQGFRALEDNRMRGRSLDTQNSIATEMERLGMQMGVFVATADFANPTFASGNKAHREKFLKDIRESVEVAKRVNARWCTVVPGKFDHKLPLGYQTANVVENLKYCADICEPAGLVMVLEPLNHWTNHPELFLHKIPQAYMICRSVNNPSCKILFDIYHQQITEGNLIPNINQAWQEIAYFQIGDNPGRKEPGTGEINYRNVFKHIFNKGFGGILGMEHGNSQPGVRGEQAVIEAYVRHDKRVTG